MLSSKEARQLTKTSENALVRKKIMDEILIPFLEEEIRSSTKKGFYFCIVKTDVLMNKSFSVDWLAFSKKTLVDAIVQELKNSGYSIHVPASQCSIHINW